MEIYYRFYIILQKGTSLAITQRCNCIEDVLPILKHLNCEAIKELIRQGLTDENICEGLYQEITSTDMGYLLGPGKSDKGEFNIYVQSEQIQIFDEDLDEAPKRQD